LPVLIASTKELEFLPEGLLALWLGWITQKFMPEFFWKEGTFGNEIIG